MDFSDNDNEEDDEKLVSFALVMSLVINAPS
jgi:hypothetical protein